MKLLALDMDGTLLNSRGKISLENARALHALPKKEVKIVIATGRYYDDAVRELKEADLVCPVIGLNGADIRDTRGRSLYQIHLPTDAVTRIVDFSHISESYIELYTEGGIYSHPDGRAFLNKEMHELQNKENIHQNTLERLAEKQFQQAKMKKERNIKTLIAQTHVYKILFFSFDPQKLKRIKAFLNPLPTINVSSSGTYNVEITQQDATKGNGLRFLARQYDISLADTVVIGDNLNDLSMFHVARTRIAMSNAHPTLKKEADRLTYSNDEHGVAYAVRELWLS